MGRHRAWSCVAAFGVKRAHLRRRRDGRAHAQLLHLVQRRTTWTRRSPLQSPGAGRRRRRPPPPPPHHPSSRSRMHLARGARAASACAPCRRRRSHPRDARRRPSPTPSPRRSSAATTTTTTRSWPPSPSGVSGTTPGTSARRELATRIGRALGPQLVHRTAARARACCAERRIRTSGGVAQVCIRPKSSGRHLLKKRSVERENTEEGPRPTSVGPAYVPATTQRATYPESSARGRGAATRA